jgi:D-alanine-D-alanine ligase
MRIGITYDLREHYLARGYSLEETAEFDRPDTIAAIAAALEACGHETVCIGNIGQLTGQLAAGKRWDLVFNIAEGLQGFGREAQVPALLEAFGIPYTFSDPMVLCLCLHKAMTKRIIRDHGLATADFAVVASPDEIAGVRLAFPLFAKPVAEGTGKGVTAASRVDGPQALEAVCRGLLDRFGQPVLVERFLPGREFTVGVLGTGKSARCLGAMEVLLKDNAEAGAYSYQNKQQYEDRIVYRLVDEPLSRRAEALALAAWKALGCRDAGRIDIRTDEQQNPCFIEVNPLAGLHPVHSDLCILAGKNGMGYPQLIQAIVNEARRRHGL